MDTNIVRQKEKLREGKNSAEEPPEDWL